MPWLKLAIGQFERKQPFADAARHLVDRQAVSGHGVPQPEEFYLFDGPVAGLVVFDAEQPQEAVAHPAKRILEVEHGCETSWRGRRGRPAWHFGTIRHRCGRAQGPGSSTSPMTTRIVKAPRLNPNP